MLRRTLGALVALLIAGGLSVAASAPVQAHNVDSWQWCLGANVCTSTNNGGGGDHLLLNTSQGYCRNIGSTFNDRISGVDNHLNTSVHFWWDANCNGYRASYGPQVTQSYVGSWHNDRFSSYCVGAWTESSCAYWE